jgi:hypothetical protein
MVGNAAHRDFWYWAARYPDSKFVLQIRDEKDWLRSLKHHLGSHRPNTETRRMKRIGVLGRYNFNSDYHRLLYDAHTEQVLQYFAGTNRLLVHHTGLHGYAELCKFLDVPIVQETWSRMNKTKK